MTQCLFVVIGAGASYASTSPENVGPLGLGTDTGSDQFIAAEALRPPLVTELFDPRFAGILNKYPLAQMAASDIRKRRHTPVAIEEFLREQYRHSTNALDQRKFHGVHWYLQDLFWSISRFFTSHPDNYDRLISGCLRLPRVIFITLNYDTLLDDRLRIVQPIDSMDGYTPVEENWGLVKLHGSVDWGIPIQGPAMDGRQIVFDSPPEIYLSNDILLRRPGANSIEDIRLDRTGSQYFYPAMSVPVGTRDEFSCPDAHIGYLRNAMAAQDGLDVLMLGYSALDEEVLTLFKDSEKTLKSLVAVNADRASAKVAHGRVVNVLGNPSGISQVYDKSFADFVGTDDLDSYLRLI
jgi:hypothetical protein